MTDQQDVAVAAFQLWHGAPEGRFQKRQLIRQKMEKLSRNKSGLRSSLSGPAAEKIDRICDDFEQAWRASRQPKIEDLPSQIEEPLRDELLCELIAAEIDLRRECGEKVSQQEYLDRFPSQQDVVREAFRLAPRHSSSDGQASIAPGDIESLLPESAQELPTHIDRYRIERELGRGGFGIVYLAHDPRLDRRVAIKVPRPERIGSCDELQRLLDEARHAARLDHPRIVRIYDVQQLGQSAFVVQQYVEGQSLGECLKKERLSPRRIAQLLASTAETLSFAHRQGLVHRDLKPDNILLDCDGAPHIADFGLALHESVQRRQRGERAGSPAYMSPEQIQRLSHRLDGRSDIWSLGVILYEMLTRRLPFGGGTREFYEEILHREPRPPRQIDPTVPAELERICLKCLSKRMTDRYTTATDLADDLRQWESATTRDSALLPPDRSAAPTVRELPPIKVIPKGLRSFDAGDAEFFLELLPGPRDRDGLPASIRFWKQRIEQTDPDNTVAVGLIYGPSGCGKSSLVKAGLLPRLAPHVIPVYVEATGADTEVRLLKGLSKRLPWISRDYSLPEVFESLREGRGIGADQKVLVVLDQFEQWLHAKRGEHETQLIEALRHCDGKHVQCVVLVRDDFWLAVSRFMRALEVEIVEGRNSALLDLFDPLHARKVLEEFGRAYGRLPDHPGECFKDQDAFLDQAVTGLAEDGKIVSVRLALFADMVKGKPWTPATLKEVGGAEGIGVVFLEETFSASTAAPRHRLHQKAARAILKELLPESGTEIKGGMKSREQLLNALKASHRANKPSDLDELLQILDAELRLITPTDPEGMDESGEPGAVSSQIPGTRYYQLTHDYLVPSIRAWLTRKQKETRRGRAELRLAERASLWQARPENRHLPSFWEFLSIWLLTRPRSWTTSQRRMMSRATRVHSMRCAVGLVITVVAVIGLQQGITRLRHRYQLVQTRTAVAGLATSSGPRVPLALDRLRELPSEMVLTELRSQFAQGSAADKTSLAYGLAAYNEPNPEFLIAQVKEASPGEADNLATALGQASGALSSIQEAAGAAHAEGDWPLKSRLALLALLLGEPALVENMCQLREDPIQRTIFMDETANWHGDLSVLLKWIPDTASGYIRSALCLAVGSVPIGSLGRQEKQVWQSVLEEWHREQPDAGTHSASGFALRAWQLPLPELPESSVAQTKFGWERTKMGLTMLRIPAGEYVREKLKVQLDEFLLSDTEVTTALFQQFMDDDEYTGEKPTSREGISFTQTGAYPVHQVSWYEAVMFCNWLSRREGRQPCYEKTGKKDKLPSPDRMSQEEYDAWQLVEASDGYRLPIEAQWEHACRSGSTTTFALGGDDSRLHRYAVYNSTHPEPVGSKWCNGWGLFDMHGNAWEWCHDLALDASGDTGPYGGYLSGLDRMVRGGSWFGGALLCRSSYRIWNTPSNRGYSLGFRLARVYIGQVK